MKFLLRWAVTFLAFPLGGFLVLPLTPVEHPLAGAAVGLVTGLVLGLAQWWALRGTVRWPWAAATAAAMTVGMATAVAITGGPTSGESAVVTGLITGAVVGAAQGIVLGRGVLATAAWTVLVSGAWALGWLVTSNVITDVGNGFAIFGASGAVAVTVVTGLALAAILRITRTGGLAPAAASAPIVAPVR
jgi:hypothetical protein